MSTFKSKVMKYPVATGGIILGLVVIFVIIFDFFGKNLSGARGELHAWLYFFTGATTVIIALIAGVKLSGNNDREDKPALEEGEFLLHIDERWSSKEIIKAKMIIHGFYAKWEEREHEHDICLKKVGKEICEISLMSEEKEDFAYLRNFLDFMETIGYLRKRGYVSPNSLNELCGESLKFYYLIFRSYIEQIRQLEKRRGNKDANKCFEHFQALIEELNCS